MQEDVCLGIMKSNKLNIAYGSFNVKMGNKNKAIPDSSFRIRTKLSINSAQSTPSYYTKFSRKCEIISSRESYMVNATIAPTPGSLM